MRALALLLAASIVSISFPAAAQGDNPYKTGVKLENSGDLVGALVAFESIPVEKRDFNTRLHIASCMKKLGRLLEAERDYESIRTDSTADPATVDTAASDLDDLRPRIPKLVVKLSAATSGVKVTVDGHVTNIPATVTVNPGTHSVIATRGDAQVFKRDVTLAESTTIEVEVDAPAPASAPLSGASSTPTTSDVAPESASSQKTWGYISLAAGGVFAATAIGAWVYSGSPADDYNDTCRRVIGCDESLKSKTRTWETISLVSAGVAVIGIGVGVTLLLTAPKERPVAVTAGLNGVFVVGRF
jgi:hypothetical protein